MMRIGSLFSGAGGLDMAGEQVFGAETVWHCENNPAASKVLAARWPGVPNHHDITTTDWSTVEPIDILCGGWPCQPFSMAGKRKGVEDERALWPFVARAVRMVRPRYVVLENVSAVLGPEFSRVSNDLAEIGYDTQWCCLRASDIGAPHRRDRLFVLATDTAETRRGRKAGGDGGWHTTIGGTQTDRPEHGRGATSANPSGDGRHERWPEPTRLERGSDAAVGGAGPAADTSGERHGGWQDGGVVGRLDSADESDDREREWPRELAGYRSSAVGGDGPVEQWGKYEPAIRRWEQLTRPAPNPTEPNTKGNPRLSAAFAEWMMGWPPGWVTAMDIPRNAQLKIIGNGVVPQQATAALSWLLRVMEMAA